MKKNKFKFLVVGLGSMGKRRIRNLANNGQSEIVGYDILPERMREAETKYGIKTVKSFKDISTVDFDAILISTPPDMHGDFIRFALKENKHFFVEHPTSDDGYKNILKNRNQKIVMAPSCTLRFYEPVKIIKKMLDKGVIGKILAYQYHMGQYLPDWHPWEDYRKVYFSKKETSACREMLPFELTWLNWIFKANVSEISGYIQKVSNLDMDADDIVVSSLKYDNGILGSIIIDVISRKPLRTLKVIGENGVLEWERFDSKLKIFNTKLKKTKTIRLQNGHPAKGYINEEEMYDSEIDAFIKAMEGKRKFPHTFQENLNLLNVLFSLEKSQLTGKVINLKNDIK